MRGLVFVGIVLLAVACNGGGEALRTATPELSPQATATPTPTSVEYPPKVSLTEGGVYLMRPDGTDLRHLTPGEGGLYGFRWSPDGSRIAVVTSACSSPRVSVIDVDGGGAVEVAAYDGSAWGESWIVGKPLWSPDGRQLAVSARRYEEGEPLRTFLINADGSGEPIDLFEGWPPAWSPDGSALAFIERSDKGVTLKTFDLDTHTATVIERGLALNYLAWSPDSQRLAYSIQTRPLASEEVVIIDRDGWNRRVIAEPGSRPEWSPDGEYLAFIGTNRLVTAAKVASGVPPIQLVPGQVLSWSPEGDALVVWHKQDSTASLSLVSVTAGEVLEQATDLTGQVVPASSVSLSPDGERLVFIGSDSLEEGYNALYVVSADGMGLQKLARPSRVIGWGPEWSPDGRYIAFVDTIITSCP